IGIENALKVMEATGDKAASWIHEMLKKGHTSFYKIEDGKRKFYDQSSGEYKEVPGGPIVNLNILKRSNIVWQNQDTSVTHIGDGVLNIEFHTKMNTIGGGVVEGINKAIDIAESDYKGVTIYNNG